MARFALTALLALAATTVNGSFTIPQDLPDGIYDVSYDDSGNSIHTGEDGHSSTQPAHKRGLTDADIAQKHNFARGQGDGTHCSPHGIILPPNEITLAQNLLASKCDSTGDEFVPKYSGGTAGARYAKKGTVAAYVCNYSSNNTQHCKKSEVDEDFEDVHGMCGNVAGFVSHFSDWKKQYGYEDATKSFC